jgi:hypothetical protein
MILTQDEKKYLFSKLEYKKKKMSINTENELFQLLTGKKIRFSDDEFKTIISSLEFSFRKRLIGDIPDLNNDIFLSIKNKMPDDLIVVKFGNINRKPSKTSLKSEIISYLKRKNIDFDEKSNKADLLGLFEKHIKLFDEF